jgi:ABC-type dipeptide/oligopeptide/nickel transport system ATPase subunit
VQALDGVDLEIPRGATLALVGESGSGKSTLALCLAGLEAPDCGEITAGGPVQLVFQDAAGSLNPRMRAADLVAEPLVVRRRPNARLRALELMEQVGLAAHRAGDLPHRFSGGQRQRLALARALALEPALLILDETLSGLDLSVQGQIMNLLFDLQRSRGLTYLLISHDLRLAARVASEIAVMHAGRIVERGAPLDLLADPRHPHTRALVAAIPELPCAG